MACGLLSPVTMSWNKIKQELLRRHQHAFELDENEVRVVLGFDGGHRVPLAICRRDDESAVVVAQVATGTPSQVVTMLRAATALGVPLVVLGDNICVRTAITADETESVLQATARAALRMRRAVVAPSTDLGAFAFAL